MEPPKNLRPSYRMKGKNQINYYPKNKLIYRAWRKKLTLWKSSKNQQMRNTCS